MNQKIKTVIAEFAAWILLIAADQYTKLLAANALKGKESFKLINGVLELFYLENRGAAFSLLQGATYFFYIVACITLTVIAVFLVKLPSDRKAIPFRIIAVLIAAGAAGNLIDRVLLGYVRDFIYFSLIDFPVFNVADIYVTCSVFVLVFLVIFVYKDDDLEFLNFTKK